jgi:ubiquinone/menaquinone biosynthesis C-methylase UbiE
MKQIDSTHYDFQKYMNLARWACYYHQIKKTLSLRPTSVLEIGPGDGIYGEYLKKNGIKYSSADHADDISSDYKVQLGEEQIPVADNSFDLVVAFQVLEHIKFEAVPKALAELKRVTSKYVFLDIPEYSFHLTFSLKVPLLPYLQWHVTIPRPKKHVFDGFHHWEVSKQGFSREKVRSMISEHFTILEEYTIFQNPKERFYLLQKK